MGTLTATREVFGWANKVTVLRDEKGAVKKIDNGKNQIRKGLKSIIIRGKEYLIDWTNATKL